MCDAGLGAGCCRPKAGGNLCRHHWFRTKPETSGAGPIGSIPVVEVVSEVIAATSFLVCRSSASFFRWLLVAICGYTCGVCKWPSLHDHSHNISDTRGSLPCFSGVVKQTGQAGAAFGVFCAGGGVKALTGLIDLSSYGFYLRAITNKPGSATVGVVLLCCPAPFVGIARTRPKGYPVPGLRGPGCLSLNVEGARV